ncbi:HWE histidine kinase domain-containing protein [Alloyangia pacifica]|uniref:histidine kinase n=1 Tax=Alloyangia pacifica TaxID=311180 RepID=A0A1I6VNG9_9RHOB|nr:HWE histidine kinase domain-containing protein [Alloyangia pacifica]SDI07094.1 Two-component sensor histidine kinase, contains HisKA and HATPase domains [Alloyangia pacifica]SFT15238.1 Two-component sensor histidine kinase, contains HisKA and HATPase domains [Alloyangia pacifica]
MLRQQSPTYGPMDFLAGDGEMATLIRERDWSAHPFGPSDDWPQSLRSALAICLNSAFPTAIYWGSDLRLLYNDAWAPIPGPRHPAALGAPAKEVWSDIWSIIEPQFSEVIRSGKGLFLQDHMLPMQRYGFEEETYWSYSFTPLRGEQGNIVGVWNTGSETTGNVIQRRNAEFLVKLNEALRGAGSAQDGLRIAIERLGVHLSAAGAGLAVPAGPGVPFTGHSEWRAPQAPALSAQDLPWISAEAEAMLRDGKDLFLTRRATDLDPQSRAYLEARRISNAIFVPWIEGGRLEHAFYLHWCRPRAQSMLDMSLVERVLDLVMGWMAREKTHAREAVMAQEIDHRARNMLAILRSTSRLIKADTVAEFREKLDERITSLSRTHGLLSRKKWVDVTFREVIDEEFSPYGGSIQERVTLEGPCIRLEPNDAQMAAMLMHELTTNAVKHGALRESEGALRLHWSLSPDGALSLLWDESFPAGGRPDIPEAGHGFGTQLLARITQDHFGGSIERDIGANHLRYRIVLRRGDWATQSGAHPETPAHPAEETERRSVMIVEDEPIIALDLVGMMEHAGYAIFGQFGSVSAALAGTEAALPDLALLDENLGGEKSTRLLDHLLAKGVPVVIISGYDGEVRTGVPRLSKPISEAELLSTLENL